ncbi:MAG TPA: hypothetical protein VG370_12660 [Chloroflexota bacterium]|jgi:hypothetical protein|nr:hypothetical protein [Chloroflexota bacterium]
MARVLSSDEAALVAELRRRASAPATAEELAEAGAAFDAIKKLRASMGPIELTLEELLSDDDGEGD